MVVALLPVYSSAEQAPAPGRLDPRVRTVAYHPQQLVTVTTYYGVSTVIRFADNEAIEEQSVDAGDRGAWSIKVSARKNILFVRPKLQKADTNLTVVTNRRVYLFLLDVLPAKPKKKAKPKAQPGKDSEPEAPDYSMAASRSSKLTYSLTFTYPDEDQGRVDARRAVADRQKSADTLRQRMLDAKALATNTDYWMAGDDAIAPTDARDDGRFIYLTFAHNRDLPHIEGIDAAGRPFTLNPAVEGNTVIIDRMVRKLVLRKGDGPDGLVVCVVNQSFNPDGGADNTSGTIASNVRRILKEDSK